MKEFSHKKTIDVAKTPKEQVLTKRLELLVLFLLLFVSVSSCVIGYLIGRTDRIDRYTGQIIDTIIISSGQTTEDTPSQTYQINNTLTVEINPVAAPNIIVADDISPSQVWTQVTSIDIFAERSGNSGVKTIDGTSVIAPGSTGKYIFKIKNPEPFSLEYTIELSETDQNIPELPMRYRLKQGISGDVYIGGNDWKNAENILAAGGSLAAGGVSFYTLEWKWDTSDDSIDTAIGMQEGGPVYILDITISAQFK